ncbi:universal stress protein [Nocardioides plantarum]|uniref:Universal stress protein n=1 Tax=Nocardioides plantarum TaxID=29299 RepID=A0ABV5K7J0_9ACTN|nr:universal stress protein [Nocardioides plantarum]
MNAAAAVVVAVDRDGSAAAVRRGAADAARTGRPLRLVHVCAGKGPAEQVGREALVDASTRSRQILGTNGGEVSTHLLRGSAVPELARAASGCALLVTERRAPGAVLHPAPSLTAALAAATDCPLLSVPRGWADGKRGGTVTMGLDVAHGQHVALRSAVVSALLHHTVLRVISATWRRPGSGSAELARVDPGVDREAREEIGRLIDQAGGDLCGVALELVRGRPEDLLVAASRESTLVVLGRHSPLLRSGSRLGPVARAVLRRSACPVLLAAPEGARRVAASAPA